MKRYHEGGPPVTSRSLSLAATTRMKPSMGFRRLGAARGYSDHSGQYDGSVYLSPHSGHTRRVNRCSVLLPFRFGPPPATTFTTSRRRDSPFAQLSHAVFGSDSVLLSFAASRCCIMSSMSDIVLSVFSHGVCPYNATDTAFSGDRTMVIPRKGENVHFSPSGFFHSSHSHGYRRWVTNTLS